MLLSSFYWEKLVQNDHFSILSLAHHTRSYGATMIFHINTLLPALEVNGMALLQEKPMVEVAFVVVYTFPAMF